MCDGGTAWARGYWSTLPRESCFGKEVLGKGYWLTLPRGYCFDGVPPCSTGGPDLRELTLRHYDWSRDTNDADEPWPWVWAQKPPSMGSVIIIVGSGDAAAAAIADVCLSHESSSVTVVAIGDEIALRALGVGSGSTQSAALLDAAVHSRSAQRSSHAVRAG